ncbi:unnamed protein product, partial [Porites evermanni]
FPTGFHGHFRSKSRSEFTIPYRQRAKPCPPRKFLNYATLFRSLNSMTFHDSFRHDLLKFSITFGLAGMGKRKYLQPGQTQHTRGTQDIITWRGNECPNPSSTYRSDFPSSSRTSSRGYNESEPIHVRSNLELRRRHLRAASAPPSQRRTAPLLAWNEPDDALHGKPGVGLRQPIREQGPSYASATPFANTAPAALRSQTVPSSKSFTVSETIVPLSTT